MDSFMHVFAYYSRHQYTQNGVPFASINTLYFIHYQNVSFLTSRSLRLHTCTLYIHDKAVKEMNNLYRRKFYLGSTKQKEV